MRSAAPAPQPDNPLELLRDAIEQLKSSNGIFPDQTQVANLLAEARVALQRANVIARAVTKCDGLVKQGQFEQAFAALDAGLLFYPAEPVLVTRRREVEEQHKAFGSAAVARMAIEEAQWLLDQDRLDLAVNFLRNKVAELPVQPSLMARLEELEGLLPEWEQKRYVQTTLGRAAALEQLEQWQAALTILEEALPSYPECTELTGAANRVRDRLVDHERKKKLARRLELIGQKIAAQSWRPVLTLLEDTRKEFPGTPELDPLQREVETGLSRSECEAVVTEVRQCLADGDLEQAEQVLLKGLESLGPEPTLEALCEELESVRKYREELRTAQVLFGQRRLEEAESVLAQLAAPDRPEAKALLDAVREARIAAEEENFRERGREKALELIRQEQFAQAADLLRNLLSLNPGNPILEKDLMVAQSGLDQGSSAVDPAIGKEHLDSHRLAAPTTSPPVTQPTVGLTWADTAAARRSAFSRFRRFRRAAIVGTWTLVLVSVSVVAWKLVRNGALIPRPAAVQLPAETPLQVTPDAAATSATPLAVAPPKLSPQPLARQPHSTESTASSQGKTQPQPLRAKALRRFIPGDMRKTPVQSQDSPLLPPPVTAAIVPVLPGTGLGAAAEPERPTPSAGSAPPAAATTKLPQSQVPAQTSAQGAPQQALRPSVLKTAQPPSTLVGRWTYSGASQSGSPFPPESATLAIVETNGQVAGTFTGRYRVPKGRKFRADVQLRFAGPVQPGSQRLTFTAVDGATGEIEVLRVAGKPNEVEVVWHSTRDGLTFDDVLFRTQ